MKLQCRINMIKTKTKAAASTSSVFLSNNLIHNSTFCWKHPQTHLSVSTVLSSQHFGAWLNTAISILASRTITIHNSLETAFLITFQISYHDSHHSSIQCCSLSRTFYWIELVLFVRMFTTH